MTVDIRNGFRLGGWRAYPLRNLLIGPAGEVRVEPKVMQLLERLAANAGDVVERDELLEKLWGGRAVSDEPLTRCVATLRRVLDDSPKDPEYVQTIPKRGYRLVCPVEPLESAMEGSASDAPGTPTRRRLLTGSVAVLAVFAAGYFGYRLLQDDGADTSEVAAETAVAVTPPVHSIAVLPFANLSPNPDNEYLSDGLAAELLNQLTAIPELRVAARTSAFAFKGRDADVSEIARQLRVAHVLAGSVRQSGDRLRISAQLIEADSGYHVWSNTWERPFTDVFEIQDEVTASVVESLRVELLGDIPPAQRADPEAYKLFLKSLERYREKAEPDIGEKGPTRQEEALSLVMHAISIDPDYAPAWSLLAEIQANQALWMWMQEDNEQGYARARASAERALRLDPADEDALRLLATIAINSDWDFTTAALWFRKALDANPGDPATLNAIDVMYAYLGRPAPAFVRDVDERDPLNVAVMLNRALGYRAKGEFDDAREQLEKVRRIAPDAGRLAVFEAMFALLDGDFEKAARLADGVNPPIHLCALERLGRHDQALAGLEEQKGESRPVGVADTYACWGDVDNAFDWLQRAYDERLWSVVAVRDSLLLETLHDDPRWERFLRQVGVSDDVGDTVDGIIRGEAM